MKQISAEQRLCSRCQTAMVTGQQFCSVCNTKTEVIDLQAGEDPFQDDDRTVRAGTRLSSRLYLKAVEQSLAQEPSQPPVDPLRPNKANRRTVRQHKLLVLSIAGLVLLLLLLVAEVTGYSSTVQSRQHAEQAKAQLDRQLQHAQEIGLPVAFLQPLRAQEQQINNGAVLFALLHNQLVAGYYQRQVAQYNALLMQIPDLITAANGQLQEQAQRDVQNLQSALVRVNTQGIGNLQSFAQRLSQEQLQLASAHNPGDYTTISADARSAIQALDLLASTFQQLNNFSATIAKMKQGHLDVSLMQTMYQNDLQLFNSAVQQTDFQNLSAQINAQYQQAVVNALQVFPYISTAKLNELQTQVSLLKTYGVDNKSYQARLNAEQVAVEHASTIADDLSFLNNIDADIAALHDPLIHAQAYYLLKQFHSEVDIWAKAHPYHDSYDGRDYFLNNGYMRAGLGGLLDRDMAAAQTGADFETMVDEVNNALFNLYMLEADYKDQTAYNQVHASDMQMIRHYALQKRQVMVVSLVEQSMRIYQNGLLVKSFMVTTGRQELPSIPGVWSVLERRAPIIFQAAEPRNSPYWFPDTPIHYAVLYHLGGYFVHDAPWREAFGPGTQFPHQDPIGTSSYNFDGSHGCINLQENDAAWVYSHTDWNTAIVIY